MYFNEHSLYNLLIGYHPLERGTAVCIDYDCAECMDTGIREDGHECSALCVKAAEERAEDEEIR